MNLVISLNNQSVEALIGELRKFLIKMNNQPYTPKKVQIVALWVCTSVLQITGNRVKIYINSETYQFYESFSYGLLDVLKV